MVAEPEKEPIPFHSQAMKAILGVHSAMILLKSGSVFTILVMVFSMIWGFLFSSSVILAVKLAISSLLCASFSSLAIDEEDQIAMISIIPIDINPIFLAVMFFKF